jgi:multimeric flavodoxin WrbA
MVLKWYFMKILGIVGSSRKNGNTEILTSECLKAASSLGAETYLIRLSELNISPCDGCQYCRINGECKIKDDMQIIYQSLINADGIIVSTPVYFWTVSALTKIFMDRTYAFRYPTRKLKGKVGGAIAVASHRGCSFTLSTINNFFLHHKMIVAGLGVSGYASEIGDIKKDERALRDSRELGVEIVELLKNRRG